MGKCFVMQPFDGGVFDKRFDDVFAPAIKDAGLEPYRVDQDPGVTIPIDDITEGIRHATLCLAEITTDNPNVWFELGFAIAVFKEVVLVCSDERASKFPFDIQHRKIITYTTDSVQDFSKLKSEITNRLLAILEKQKRITEISKISPISETEGLSQHEMVSLVVIMQNSFISGDGVVSNTIKEDMNKAGFTDIAVSLAVKSLIQKQMVEENIQQDELGYRYNIYSVTASGEEWLLNNQERLMLQDTRTENSQNDDDLPF